MMESNDGTMGNTDELTTTRECMAQQMLDPGASIADRWWALFSLRNSPGVVAREALIAAMRDPSALLAHEAAYALGQMQDVEAVPALTSILKDVSGVFSIVRHEAAEALGAISAPDAVAVLRESLESDPAPEVRETCELALRRIDEGVTSGDDEDSPFFSVDPVGRAAGTGTCAADLRKVLLDEDIGMYERYGALFALRNRGGAEAVSAIVAALSARSALLKHEVAYVLGQLRDKSCTDALVRTIMDKSEHPMVRHEAAEALGPIADAENIAVIEKYRNDPEPLVAQSCEVALSLVSREMQGKSFDFLQSVNVEA